MDETGNFSEDYFFFLHHAGFNIGSVFIIAAD